jgi:hypothetical protein
MAAGAKLGPYEILAPIGAGGMGEVYRAHDTKLKRDVALKVLPEVFASDPGRMARFQREAEVLPRWVPPGPHPNSQPPSASERKIKDGRHVGLDFYDLLIDVGLRTSFYR